MGVARRVAEEHQRKTSHYKDKPLGILTDQESQEFIDALDRIQDAEEKLFHFVKVRIDHEKVVAERREIAEKHEQKRL